MTVTNVLGQFPAPTAKATADKDQIPLAAVDVGALTTPTIEPFSRLIN
jgi:hypothetical protein